jgi:hypothetical protein
MKGQNLAARIQEDDEEERIRRSKMIDEENYHEE